MADKQRNHAGVYFNLALVMLVGPLNFFLFRVLYDMYGPASSFFVSQGVNAMYVIIGGAVLYPRMWTVTFGGLVPNYSEITRPMRALPQGRFVAMAFLDSAGTFFAAMGAFYTPGQTQTLLNQSLIPCTMVASALWLRSTYGWAQCLGAATILAGALVAALPHLLTPGSSSSSHPSSGGGEGGSIGEDDATAAASIAAESDDGGADGIVPLSSSHWMAVVLYACSNVPMALSAVYKEMSFGVDAVHPLYLTQWVSIYQFLLGFVLAPLCTFPGISSPQGMSLYEIWSSFVSGWNCFLEKEGACPQGSFGTFFLLWAYCGVNFVFNTLGLFLTKHGGASLSSLSYSMLLPLVVLSNALPVLGPFTEDLQGSTLVGLTVVLAGFGLYEKDHLWPLCRRTHRSRGLAAGAQDESEEEPQQEGGRRQQRPAPRERRTAEVSWGDFAPLVGEPPLVASGGGCSAGREEEEEVCTKTRRVESYQERLILVPLPIPTSPTRGARPEAKRPNRAAPAPAYTYTSFPVVTTEVASEGKQAYGELGV